MKYKDYATELHNFLRVIYHKVPDSIRYGKIYRKQLKFLKITRTWSDKEIEEWQFFKLKSLINDAYKHTKYYKKLFDELKIKPEDIRSNKDFEHIPFVTREILQKNREDFISTRFKRKELKYATTSGTSGVPLGIYLLKDHYKPIEMAFLHDIWTRFGYKTNRKNAHLRGYSIKNDIYQKHGLHLLLSSYKLKDENIDKYLNAIRTFEPEFIQAFPSSIYIVCKYMAENSLPPLHSVKLLLLSSENLYEFQRELIKKTLNISVCNLYGHVEVSAIAANCPESDFFHFYPEYGYVEILNEKHKPCTQENEIGEIVATSFVNPAFYLIRYKTGDLVEFTNKRCRCGWKGKLVKTIKGREQDFIITKRKQKMRLFMGVNSLTNVASIHSDIFQKVLNFQFVQEYPGQVVFTYIPKRSFKKEHETIIFSHLCNLFGKDIDLKLQRVNHIELNARGKQRYLIQHLKIDY